MDKEVEQQDSKVTFQMSDYYLELFKRKMKVIGVDYRAVIRLLVHKVAAGEIEVSALVSNSRQSSKTK